MKAALIVLLLAVSALSQDPPVVYDWIQEGSYFKLYSMYLEDFIREHPKTLVVIYDSSPHSQAVLDEIESVHDKLAQKGIKLSLAKLFHGDAERHIITWNVHHFPHLRLFVGEDVYIDLNMYPSSDNVFNELTRVLAAEDTITEIATPEDKAAFLKEPVAFYLRFPEAKRELIYFLEKIQQLDSKIKVYYTHKPELDPFKAVKPEDMVVGIRRNFDDPTKFISSESRLDRNAILSFYHAYRQPDVHSLDEDLLYAILSKKIRTVVFFEDEERPERVANFKRLAFQYKNEFMFVIAKPNSPAGSELREFARVDTEGGDVARILVFREKDVLTYPVGITSFGDMDHALTLFNKGALEQISDGPFIDGEL